MRAAVIFALFCFFLAGCGVKLGNVDPPVGKEDSSFPHDYPNLGTDPSP